jgi:DUF4097 and DUF4098 domain-containing protein YvlB
METSVSYNVMQLFNTSYRIHTVLRLLSVCLVLAAICQAEVDKITVPLTDPARPALVKVNLLSGSIVVTAYDGKDVIVQAKAREENESTPPRGGMKRVPINTTGLSVEEENNQVDIGTQSIQRTIDLNIQVPRRTSLHLKTVNDGDITVTGVDGEMDVDDINGDVTLKNVSGNAVAHALNGKLLVTFDRINPQKAMAFSSLNGDVDVTFPPDLKANASMSSDRGDVFSDFDIQLEPRALTQTPVEGQRQNGRFRVKVDKMVRGKINGGGPEIQFKNFNGNIYIRRASGRAASAPAKTQ